MEANTQLNGLKILQDLIFKMEKGRQQDNPEYIIGNIELMDKIINILEGFKSELKAKIPIS